ncbi:hypothetical protein [Planctomyces sp. SH-PL14]|uniref:hypothetical protein n=1 Tax=Planctomyces sp. SH-PL14 TaxID=1632864 RepID=UPI00078D7D41|nr:hypothetical protein [Planctomyces sp. SH-PL14]AMV19262.1 hypothetical protein VT03_15330 [Planctomyces sp. SH-PL14]
MGKSPSKKLQGIGTDPVAKPLQERASRKIVDESIEHWERRVWKKGVPEIVTVLAKAFAYMAEDYFKFFQIQREGHFHQLRTFTTSEWESLYLNPNRAGRFVRRKCGRSVRSLRTLQVGVRWFLHRWNQLNALNRMVFLFRLMTDKARHLASLETWGLPLRVEFQKGLREIDADDGSGFEHLDRAESQFFVTVWLPSMLLLGKCPAKLYELAAAGELSAACELLRLDPFAVQLPVVEHFYRELLRENNPARLEAFRLAQTESVDLPSGRAKFKEQFAAKVIALSQRWCEIVGDSKACLDPVDLWNLFDLIAKERGRGNDSVDLKNYETFRKHVRDSEIELSTEGWDIFR